MRTSSIRFTFLWKKVVDCIINIKSHTHTIHNKYRYEGCLEPLVYYFLYKWETSCLMKLRPIQLYVYLLWITLVNAWLANSPSLFSFTSVSVDTIHWYIMLTQGIKQLHVHKVSLHKNIHIVHFSSQILVLTFPFFWINLQFKSYNSDFSHLRKSEVTRNTD